MDLETNYQPFQQQLNQISGKSTNMVSAAFGKLGKLAAGAFAVTKLVQFGKESINLASDLQEVQNVVDVTFGKSSAKINDFASNAITQYGLSELSAKQYASTMGAMLKSMGLSEQATVGMSQAITGLAGDMASFYNLKSDEAFSKIRSGISGETEPLKQLGINMSVANMEAFALSQGITKSYQSMTQSEQALLRYNYLLNTTKDAQGDFSRTSDSWANQTRILSEQFNVLKSTLGSAFMTMLTPVVRMLNTLISKLQVAAAYFKSFVESITGVKSGTDDTSSGMSSLADSATEAGDATVEAANKASKALAGFDKLNVLSQSSGEYNSSGSSIPTGSDMNISIPEPDTSSVSRGVDKIKSMFGGLKTYVTTSFAPSIKSWGKAFSDLKQPVGEAVKNISSSAKGLWTNTLAPFSTYLLTDFIPNIANGFSKTFAPIFTDTMSFALKEFTKDFDFTCKQIDTLVKDIVKPALETYKTIFLDVCGIVTNEWNKSGQNLLEQFGKVRDSFKEIWTNLYENILKPVWQNIIGAIKDLWDKHLKGLYTNIVGFFSKLGECIMTIWNNFLAPYVNWMIKTFGPVLTNLINGVIAVVKTVIGIVSDVVGGIFKALGGLLDFITGIFSGNWKKAWEGIKAYFKGIWDSIWGIVKGIVNLIIDGLNLLWTGIYNVVSGIVNGIGGVVKVIGNLLGQEWGFSMPKKPPMIPKLARGGIIDQPTLAMVGESGKEAVVPLENTAFADSIANAILRVLTPLLSGTSGINKNEDGATVIILKLEEYELGRVIVGAVNKYHNVIGKVELEV